MITPWTIHEADVALYTAWKDGLPLRGPAPERASAPLFQCKAGLSIAATPSESARAGHSWTNAEPRRELDWEITVDFPDGAFSDSLSRFPSRLSPGGFYILVARFTDEVTGQWSCFRWFYVTWDSDQAGASGQVMGRSLRLRSSWLREEVGVETPPSLSPTVFGEVDWICGGQRVTCLTFDPVTEQWTSLPRNQVDSTSRYVNFAPMGEEAGADVALAAYLPRVVSGSQVAPLISRGEVLWQNWLLLRIGNHSSSLHHGLVLLNGTELQATGITEPLLTYPQARMIDEPVIVFRYLRRIYATIGHGVLAVPRLIENAAPPFTHDYAFRLAVPGDPNPATGHCGLILLPDGAWLDGTISSIV